MPLRFSKWNRSGYTQQKVDSNGDPIPRGYKWRGKIRERNLEDGGVYAPYIYVPGTNTLRWSEGEIEFATTQQIVRAQGADIIKDSRFFVEALVPGPNVYRTMPHGQPTRHFREDANIGGQPMEFGRSIGYLNFPDAVMDLPEFPAQDGQPYDLQIGMEVGRSIQTTFGFRARFPASGTVRFVWVNKALTRIAENDAYEWIWRIKRPPAGQDPDDPASWTLQGKTNLRVGVRFKDVEWRWSVEEAATRSFEFVDNPDGTTDLRIIFGPYNVAADEWTLVYPDSITPVNPSTDGPDGGEWNAVDETEGGTVNENGLIDNNLYWANESDGDIQYIGLRFQPAIGSGAAIASFDSDEGGCTITMNNSGDSQNPTGFSGFCYGVDAADCDPFTAGAAPSSLAVTTASVGVTGATTDETTDVEPILDEHEVANRTYTGSNAMGFIYDYGPTPTGFDWWGAMNDQSASLAVSYTLSSGAADVQQVAFQAFNADGALPYYSGGAGSITYVGGNAVSDSSQAGTAGLAVTSTAVQVDDFLVAFHHRNDDLGAFSTPSGWTQLFQSDTGGTGQDRQTVLYYRFAASATTYATTFSHTDTGNEQWAGVVMAFRGVDTTTPWDQAFVTATHATFLTNKATPNVDAFDTVTAVTDGAYILALEAVSHDDISATGGTLPNPTNYTELHRNTGAAEDHRQIMVWGRELTTAGNETPPAAPYTSNALVADSSQYTLAMRPAGGAPVASGRTTKANINTNWSQTASEGFGIQFSVQNEGGADATATYSLEYNHNGGGWNDVSAGSSVIRLEATGDYADGDDALQYLSGAGSFISNNNAGIESSVSLTLGTSASAGSWFEAHYNLLIVEADVSNDDTLQLRIEQGDGTALDAYDQTPTITIIADSGTPVTAEPGTAILQVIGQQPTVTRVADRTVAPGTGIVTLEGQQPTITRVASRTAQPGTGEVSFVGQQPVVAVVLTEARSPGTGQIELEGQQPVLHGNITYVDAGTGIITLAGQAPTAVAILEITADTGTGILQFIGQQPTLREVTTVTPGTATIEFQGQQVTLHGNITTVEPGTGTIQFVGQQVGFERLLAKIAQPSTGIIEFRGQQPTVTATAVEARSPGTGTIAFEGQQPTITATALNTRSPGTGTVQLVGQQPTIAATVLKTRSPGTGTITFVGQQPLLVISSPGEETVLPGTATVELQGQQPVITRVASRTAQPGTALLQLQGFAPTVVQVLELAPQPGTGIISLAGQAPTIAATIVGTANPGVGTLTLSGNQPTLLGTIQLRIPQPGTGEIVLEGQQPTLGLILIATASLVGTTVLTLEGQQPFIRNGVWLERSATTGGTWTERTSVGGTWAEKTDSSGNVWTQATDSSQVWVTASEGATPTWNPKP